MALVLVVDDEPDIQYLVKLNLELDGHEVMVASTGSEALTAVKERVPDVIVLDVMMPEMDGFEALKKLKENPATAGIPVIMLTAKAQDADVFRGWQSGADLYLTKPFNPQELITFIKRIFQSHDEEKPPYPIDDDIYNVDDIDESLLLPPSDSR